MLLPKDLDHAGHTHILAESWGALEGDGRQVSCLSHFSIGCLPRICSLINSEDCRSSTTSTAIVPYLQRMHNLAGPANQPFSTMTQLQDQGSPSGLTCTNSPKFTRSFANFSCSLLTHYPRIRDCGDGFNDDRRCGRVLGPIWVSFNGHGSVCGQVCTYLFPLRAFS